MGDKARKASLYYLYITLGLILADQLSKYLVVKNIAENESVSIIGDLLNFHFIYNEGGAMGTSLGPPWLYTILTLVALVLIVRYFARADSDGIMIKLSLATILGGAIGNLIDRIFYGKVVDFIDLDIPDIPFLHLYRWFTFNIADAAITVGLVLFGLSVLFAKKTEDQPAGHLPENQISGNESDASKA